LTCSGNLTALSFAAGIEFHLTTMAHLLGIDIGTSGTKTLICDDDGKVIATATSPHAISSPKPGWSEQNPADWWTAVGIAAKAVLKKAKLKGVDISAVGLSGQMHGSVFLGTTDVPLRPAILWNDQRTGEQCRQIETAAGGRAALIEMVANPALTGFTAPKILWVRENQPKIYAKARKVLLPKDFIRLKLTGEYATEVSDASGTLLLDVANRKWSDRLMGLLQIDPTMMPDVFESSVVTGTVTAAAAKETGLAIGTPVVGGAGDNAAGAVGMGTVRAGIVSAILGTSGVMFAHSDSPALDPAGRVHTMCHAVTGKWCVFGCMLSAGGSFQWFRNTLGASEIETARKKKVDPYELLVAEAATAPAGCEGLFFLPYLTGERCPHPDPTARGGWVGVTARTTRAMLIRSLLEGVTFGMRDALEIMTGMGIAVDHVRATGGGARSEFWRQLQADIYKKPVAVTNAAEGPAYGVALLAGVGTGFWSSVEEACAAAIQTVTKVAMNKKIAAVYDRHFAVYDRLYGDLRPAYAAMAGL
jgi:xylulokinase